MDKYKLAQYLVNLNTLLDAQTASVHNPSHIIAEEYDKVWKQLKDAINETRPSTDKSHGLNENGTEIKGDLPRRG